MAADVNEQDQRIQELEKSVAELRAQLNEQSVDSRNVELLREMVKDMGDNGPSVGQDSTLTAGYDNRFYIRRADDMFRLQIDTLMQLRHTYATTDDCDDDLMQDGTRAPFGQSGVDNSSAGAELERVRAWLRGEDLQDCDDCGVRANVQVTAEGRRTVCCACLSTGYDSSGEPFAWYAFDGKGRRS